MNDESLEFSNINDDSALPEIVRNSFRVPVKDSQNIRVTINGKQYPVLDICPDSIGIALEDTSGFAIDQIFEKCQLHLFDLTIEDLNGRIIHFSLNPANYWHCGIQWMDMNQKNADRISGIVSEMKEQFLKDDAAASD